jgi:hypothetical protein
MTGSKAWMALLFATSFLVAGCTQSALNCAGWRKIPVVPGGAVKLASDPELTPTGKGVAAHNAFGRAQKCWN